MYICYTKYNKAGQEYLCSVVTGGQCDQITVVSPDWRPPLHYSIIVPWLQAEINSNSTTELKLKRSAGGNEARVYLLFNCENLGI